MRRRVVLARTALNDLAKIGKLITEAGAPRTAQSYTARSKARLARLADTPEIGRRFVRGESEFRVVGFERRVMIVFRVEPTRVIVARVFYGGPGFAANPERR